MQKTLLVYRTRDNSEPFYEWLYSLKDKVTSARIEARLERVKKGNFGDFKRFSGLIELRFDFGKGYRLYCAEDGHYLVLLLNGGDKSHQEKDIRKALEYLEDYYEQKKIQNL